MNAASVLAWGEAHRRNLPWRSTRDPWAILVAEVMSQQTQLERVVPRWQHFIGRWPDTASMAAASLGEVLTQWQGLGYPRRARSLHEAASKVQAEHGGRFPDTLDELLELPGVGPYTARAVLAFAFEADVGVLDTNIGRILARRHGRRLSQREAQGLADGDVPAGKGWEWNSTLLDLGAALCRSEPDCAPCPLRASCVWSVAGRVDPDPAKTSAAVSRRQARYRGSLREARGTVLAAVAIGPVRVADIQPMLRPEHDGAAVVESLVADRLLVVESDVLRLPD